MKLRAWNYWPYNRGDDWYFRLFELRWFHDESKFPWLTVCNFAIAFIFHEQGEN